MCKYRLFQTSVKKKKKPFVNKNKIFNKIIIIIKLLIIFTVKYIKYLLGWNISWVIFHNNTSIIFE